MNNDNSEIEARYVAERRQRMRVVTIAIPALAGVLLAIWTSGLNDEYLLMRLGLRKELVLAVVTGLLGISGLGLVMTYLQTGFKKSEAEFEVQKLQREIEVSRSVEQAKLSELLMRAQAELQHMRAEMDRARSVGANVSEADRDALVSELKKELMGKANEEILADIRAQVAASYTRDARDRDLLQRFDESRARLARELDALTRRGNLNLALGAITTVLGLALLGFSVFAEVTQMRDTWSFVSHFVPRLTLVVLIELFAYFFLSLYKASLAEIKYFQNELTNVEAKQVALRAAISFGEPTMVADIVSKLATTERNHVLSKDQTTVELEKAKIDRDGRNDIAKYFSDLLQKKT